MVIFNMGTTDERVARFAKAIVTSALVGESEAGIRWCQHCRADQEYPVDFELFPHKPDCVVLEARKFLV